MAKYFYNDMELPDIRTPWTDERYPYATIFVIGSITWVYQSTGPHNIPETATMIHLDTPLLKRKLVNGQWSDFYINAWDVSTENKNDLKWSNHDIIDENDGSVAFAASDPVPVGGATPEYAIIPTDDYKSACDAIRAKTGKTDLIKSGDMAAEIAEMPSSSTPTLQAKTVTENGEVTADEGYDGLSKVNVNVALPLLPVTKYSYNGVVLPSVFDDRVVGIDTKLLQYICICKTTSTDGTTSYKVYFTHEKPFYKAYSGYYSLAFVAENMYDGYSNLAWATTTGNEWTDADDNSVISGNTKIIGGKNYEWVWSNTDIYDENGVLVYSASTAMPMTDAALLPPLPEWDSATYPYAYIKYVFSTGKIILYLQTNRLMAFATGGKYTESVNGSYGYYTSYSYTDGAWVLSKENVEQTGGVSFRTGNTIIWSNTDMLCSDGSVYRKADAQYCVYLIE